ncbi:hypothetical protein P5673_029122 [Acropora cervicornis]|uniref:Uncharacterized protein n=1 Tax=Acropora cervicornis TaxID=6130 RepID=A0AAD9UUB8_ACRCE|nr:hypothetical protein P5673_029122 [Acropora cervicornis]
MHTYIEPFCSTIRFLQLFFRLYGKKESVNNYRPITILPVLSKIIEKDVHHQLYILPQGEQPTGPRTSNLLTFNCSKSRLLLFGSKRRLKSPLEEAISFKYLGVIILSEDLSWGDHIKNIMSKTNQRLGLVRRIKHLLPLHARLTLHHSPMLPLFHYGDIIWGDKNNEQSSNSTKQGS